MSATGLNRVTQLAPHVATPGQLHRLPLVVRSGRDRP